MAIVEAAVAALSRVTPPPTEGLASLEATGMEAPSGDGGPGGAGAYPNRGIDIRRRCDTGLAMAIPPPAPDLATGGETARELPTHGKL